MGRKQDDQRLDEILAAIQSQSAKAGTVGAWLGLDNKTVQRALVQLEDRGDLLWEDDSGKLGWFGKRQ
jgi:predicted ArsR family transcriptional regulator